MSNTYFQYKSFHELYKKYEEVFSMLEENGGEETKEIEIKLKELEDDYKQLGWDVLQMIDSLETEIELNKVRKKKLDEKNKVHENSIKYLSEIMKSIIKQNGKLNDSGNKGDKFGERSITVTRSVGYEVEPEFNDNRFIRYSLKGKLEKGYADQIASYLAKYGQEASLDKIVLKEELNKYLKTSEEIPEGVVQVKKENLLRK